MDNTSKKNIKNKKPFYKRIWFWVVVLIVGSIAISTIKSFINSILDPETIIPSVKGLTKVEACEKIESAGFICSTGSNYDSSSKDQKVDSFDVYDRNGGYNSKADSSMRAPKSSTIKLNFKETDKQKADREEKEAEEKAKAEEAKSQESSSSNQAANSSWREFIAEYESFMNKYVDFMKKYKANPSDATLLADYGQIIQQYSEFSEKADSVKGELSGSDLSEYLNALSRISQKLAEVQ